MKIDLHVHSSERSPCGRSTDEEQVRAAIACGLDGFFFTDHHAFIEEEKLAALNRQFSPFQVFRGIEISCNEEDFLVLGVADALLAREDWLYPDLHRFVRGKDGFMVLAHPFRYHADLNLDCADYHPDAIEIRSANTPLAEQDRILRLADEWNIPVLCNSDAHFVDGFGKFYNILEAMPRDEAELLDLLRARKFRCSCEV
jgi:histidinol phosphatase-like PHP family hydrolase